MFNKYLTNMKKELVKSFTSNFGSAELTRVSLPNNLFVTYTLETFESERNPDLCSNFQVSTFNTFTAAQIAFAKFVQKFL